MSFDHGEDLPVTGAILAHPSKVSASIEIVVHFGFRLDALGSLRTGLDDDVTHCEGIRIPLSEGPEHLLSSKLLLRGELGFDCRVKLKGSPSLSDFRDQAVV